MPVTPLGGLRILFLIVLAGRFRRALVLDKWALARGAILPPVPRLRSSLPRLTVTMVEAGFVSAHTTIIKLVLWRRCAVTMSVAGILAVVSAILASSMLAPTARRAAFADLLICIAPQLARLLDHWLLIPTEVHL